MSADGRPKKLEDFDDATWDKFFDFIYDDEDDLSAEEVREELEARGIDLTAADQTVLESLAKARAVAEGGRP